LVGVITVAVGVFTGFVADVCVAACGVPDCFVATDRVTMPIEVCVVASGVIDRSVAGVSVALLSGAADSIGLGWGDESTSDASVVVGSFISGVDVT